jgi:hypothetical protein
MNELGFDIAFNLFPNIPGPEYGELRILGTEFVNKIDPIKGVTQPQFT